jgi:hypothetical protein
LGVGVGASVVYCRTSGPPVFSMMTAFMVERRRGVVERKRGCVFVIGLE